MIETTNSALNKMRDEVNEIGNEKPWITGEELNDVLDKIAEQRVWLDKKIEEQAALRLDEEPVLLEADIVSGMKKVHALFKKVTEKKKPREAKFKVEKTEDKEGAEGAEDKEAKKEQAEEKGEWDL